MTSAAGKPRLLIIDDDKANLLVLNDILREDYAVHTAKSGAAGLRIAQVVHPDLILLDIVMEGINGYDVLITIRNSDSLKDIPVILLTGLASVESEARGFRLGADDYITKPFNNTIVKMRVNKQVQAVQQRRAIERNALLDGLTGIPNRRAHDRRLEMEWGNAVREQTPLGLIMIDADHFKAYNDHFGHPRGDELLQTIATTITGCLKRPADFAARIGGEEFAIILPNTKKDGAAHIAETIRAAIQNMWVPNPGSPKYMVVTVSLGVGCIVPTTGDAMADFVACCDKALYTAKKEGKNRVVECSG